MDAIFLQTVESNSQNEKKRFYELFDSFSAFFYSNTKDLHIPLNEKFYPEISKLVDDLQVLQDSQKIESRNKYSNPGTPKTLNKKTNVEKNDTKNKKLTSHHHTNSLDNEKKIKTSRNTPATSIFNLPLKDLEKQSKNLNLKIFSYQQKTNGKYNINSMALENHKNGTKLLNNNELPPRSKSKEFDKTSKLPPLASPIRLKKNEIENESALLKNHEQSRETFAETKKKSKSVYSPKKETLKPVLGKNFGVGSGVGSILYMDLNARKLQIISKLKKKEGV